MTKLGLENVFSGFLEMYFVQPGVGAVNTKSYCSDPLVASMLRNLQSLPVSVLVAKKTILRDYVQRSHSFVFRDQRESSSCAYYEYPPTVSNLSDDICWQPEGRNELACPD